MKKLKIEQKFYSSKALLKMAGEGNASPTSHSGSAPVHKSKTLCDRESIHHLLFSFHNGCLMINY